MYRDDDGVATTQSQALYDARMRLLLFIACSLSFLGYGAAVINGDYARENLQFPLPLETPDLLEYGKWLWPILSLHSLSLCWKNNPVEVHAAGVGGSILSLLVVIWKLMAQESVDDIFKTSMHSLQTYTAFLLSAIQLLFPRRPALFTEEGKSVDFENSASAFGKYFIQWLNPALALAGKSVPLDELPALNYLSRSKNQPSLLINSPGTALWYRLLAVRYPGFAKQWILMCIRAIVSFGSPYCIMRLLQGIESNQGRADGVWIWLFGLGVTSTCESVLNQHLIWIQWSEMGVPVRSQLTSTIFQKAMRRKDSKDQNKNSASKKTSYKPDPINLIASDTLSLAKFTAINYLMPSAIVRLFFAFIFLWNLIRWQSSLVGLVVTGLCVPIYTLTLSRQQAARKKVVAARDKRSKAITEALHALRQIKFSALELQWEGRIEGFRVNEMKELRQSFTAAIVSSVWQVMAPLIVSGTSICTYVYFSGSITPSIVFPMVEVLLTLFRVLEILPQAVMDYSGARLNSSRIDAYLREPEQSNTLSPSPSGAVSFHDTSFAWPSDDMDGDGVRGEKPNSSVEDIPPHRFHLHRVNLDFPSGELSVVCGKTGSGKSLLLAAIIGEVDLLGGAIKAPSMAEGHPVAFVTQSSWLQSATIRANILFGSPFDNERYETVLTACALRPDLAALPRGDETSIGLRGVKLSGGQRARLAFARALYSTAQLLVLDDIFAALDAHVSKAIFEALTGKLAKGRTRILVTHQVSLCLPQTKYIAVIDNNSISYAGPPELMDGGAKIIEAEGVLQPRQSTTPIEAPETGKPLQKVQVPVQKVQKFDARLSLKVYKTYFTATGGARFMLFYVLGLVVKRLLAALSTWLMGHMNSAHPTTEPGHHTNNSSFFMTARLGLPHYLYLYLAASMLEVAMDIVFNLHMFSGSLRASRVLFHELTYKTLRMPLLWLDTTPLGDMLYIFAVDARMVDEGLLVNLSDFAASVINFILILAVGLSTSKHTSLLTALLLVWCTQVARAYLTSVSMIRLADKGPRSDIIEHFSSCAAGVSTLRAFGKVEDAETEMHRHLDRIATSRRHFWGFNRWAGLRLSLIGILFATGTGALLLLSRDIIDASTLGFSLTYSMGFSKWLKQSVEHFGVLESFMDSVAKIIGYTKLETEDQGGIDVPKDWPSGGKVEVKGLDTAYAPNLPLVLKDVSFTVGAGSTIGIVGRTGAGKSSLTLALLRLIEPRSGSVSIDDIDISTVKLKVLRSRIAFIPQDPVLFSGTIRSNLDYFKPVPEEELKEALRRVRLLAEEGDEKSGLFTLDSPISNGGSNMSQGQRQLLCLARVLLKKPMIMILDEATSSVDNKTDFLIQETIRKSFTGTLIVVAHRLRTIAGFDQVMVMGDGKVAEIGRPGELLKRKGMFYKLVEDSQDKDFITSVLLNRSEQSG